MRHIIVLFLIIGLFSLVNAAPLVTIDDPTTITDGNPTEPAFDITFTIAEPDPSFDLLGYRVVIGHMNITNPLLSDPFYDSLLVLESNDGTYTHTASWSNIEDGQYDIVVVGANTATPIEIDYDLLQDILVINTSDPPEFYSGVRAILFEDSAGATFNLNDLFFDRDNDPLTFSSLDADDCTAGGGSLFSSSTIELNGDSVNIGAPSRTIAGDYEDCAVSVDAFDGGSTTTGNFIIRVYKAGDLEFSLCLDEVAPAGYDTCYPANALDDLIIDPCPGGPPCTTPYCLGYEIQNNLSSSIITKPLDLVFVLDASGSMQEEIDSVMGSIVLIANTVLTLCNAAENPPEDCLKIGISIMEGTSATYPFFYREDLTTNLLLVASKIGSVEVGGGHEPWADFIINTIDASATEPTGRTIPQMSWREEASKLIILLTDASNDCQEAKFGPINYLSTEIQNYAVPEEITVSAIYSTDHDPSCDNAGCAGFPLCPAGEITIVTNANGGIARPYTDPSEIPEIIDELITEQITSDIMTIESESSSGMDVTVDGVIVPTANTVNRGDTITGEICIDIDETPSIDEYFKLDITIYDDLGNPIWNDSALLTLDFAGVGPPIPEDIFILKNIITEKYEVSVWEETSSFDSEDQLKVSATVANNHSDALDATVYLEIKSLDGTPLLSDSSTETIVALNETTVSFTETLTSFDPGSYKITMRVDPPGIGEEYLSNNEQSKYISVSTFKSVSVAEINPLLVVFVLLSVLIILRKS